MPAVADQLRSAREALGLTVHEVAEITKIKTDHIRALEEGRYDAFAAPVYIRGFVRTYARLLRLDSDETVAAVDSELRQNGQFAEPASSALGHRGVIDILMLQLSKVNWRVALPSLGGALVILILVFGYRAWANYRHRDPLSRLGPGLHQSTGDPGEVLPLPSPTR